jgi:hypothetical protein
VDVKRFLFVLITVLGSDIQIQNCFISNPQLLTKQIENTLAINTALCYKSPNNTRSENLLNKMKKMKHVFILDMWSTFVSVNLQIFSMILKRLKKIVPAKVLAVGDQ